MNIVLFLGLSLMNALMGHTTASHTQHHLPVLAPRMQSMDTTEANPNPPPQPPGN